MTERRGAFFVVPPGYPKDKYPVFISECTQYKHLIRFILDAPKTTLKKWPSTTSISEYGDKTYMTMGIGVTCLKSQSNRSGVSERGKCDFVGLQSNVRFRYG